MKGFSPFSEMEICDEAKLSALRFLMNHSTLKWRSFKEVAFDQVLEEKGVWVSRKERKPER